MKKYISPKVELVRFDTEDIMIVSGTTLDLDGDITNSGVGVYAWPF